MENPTSAAWALLDPHQQLKVALGDPNLQSYSAALAHVARAYAELDAALGLLHAASRNVTVTPPPPHAAPRQP